MSTQALLRLSGLALLVAFPLQVIGFAFHPPSEAVADVLRATYRPAHLLLLVSWILIVLGLPGLYTRQATRAGKFGLIAFVFTMVSAAYHFYLLLYEAFATTLLARESATQALVGDGPLAHGVSTVAAIFTPALLAWPLFGIATLRAGVLPRGSAWLQIASLPVFLLGGILVAMLVPEDRAGLIPTIVSPLAISYFLLCGGYAWGGYALWTGREGAREPAAGRPSPQPAA